VAQHYPSAAAFHRALLARLGREIPAFFDAVLSEAPAPK